MAHNIHLAALSANAMADAIAARCNGGTIKIYSGTQPSSGDDGIGAAVLLATCTFGTPAFGAAVAGVATANAIGQDADADTTGVAAWIRVLSSAAAPVYDGTAGVGPSFDCDIPTTTVVQHQAFPVNSLTFTMPES